MQACCGRQNICPLSPFMHTPAPLSWSAVSSFTKNGPFSEGQLVHCVPCLRSLRMAHSVRGSPLRADLRLVDSLTALCQTTRGKDVRSAPLTDIAFCTPVSYTTRAISRQTVTVNRFLLTGSRCAGQFRAAGGQCYFTSFLDDPTEIVSWAAASNSCLAQSPQDGVSPVLASFTTAAQLVSRQSFSPTETKTSIKPYSLLQAVT